MLTSLSAPPPEGSAAHVVGDTLDLSTDDKFQVKTEPGIDTLLDLNGSILDQGNGYWIKLEARRVAPSVGVPHGIRYSLTLHEPNGNRILGYDNAHPVKPPQRFRFAGRVVAFDHRHGGAGDKGLPYEFKDAHQLLSDFFSDVDRVLRDMNVNKP